MKEFEIKDLNFFTAANMAKSFRSNVLYRDSASVRLREKKANGVVSPATVWCKQAPIAKLLASAVIVRVAFGKGNLNSAALLTACFSSSKEF